jgi:ABC transporter
MAGWPTPRRAPDGHAGGMTATTSTEGSGPAGRTAGAAPRRPTAAAGPAIQVADLRKKFGRVAAVDDVSFTLTSGRITGFLGPNGAGKTTTLRMILGLIRPDAGTAVIAGKPYAKLANPARTVGALLDAAAAHPGRSGRDHLRVLAAKEPSQTRLLMAARWMPSRIYLRLGHAAAGSDKELRRLISAGVPGLHEHPRLVR